MNRIARSAWRTCLLLSTLLSLTGQLHAQHQPADTFTVTKTYDKAPFAYRRFLLAERAQFHIYRLTYPSPVTTSLPQNNTVPADFYVPKHLDRGAKYPAVICLHILDGNEPLTEIVCSVLASRGIPAISFKLPYYGSRGGGKGPEAIARDPTMFVGAIRQAGEDIRRTVDLLASRPEINPERIGITGISLGGIIAASAAGVEPRLYRAGLLLSGGDVLTVVHHARETQPLSAMIRSLPAQDRASLEAQIAAADPLRFAPALRDRARAGRVLMLNAAQDEVIPRACTERLAAALGISDRVVWYPGVGHYTIVADLPDALRRTAEFFAQDLPEPTHAMRKVGPLDTEVPSPRRASAEVVGQSPLYRLVRLVQQAVTMLTTEPDEGRCHCADLELSAAMTPTPARVRLVRGSQGKFAVRCRLPEIGDVAAGQSRFPWLAVGGKILLQGTEHPVEKCDALSYVEPRHLTKLRVAKGVADSIVLAPDVLEPWLTVTAGPEANAPITAQLKSQPLWRLSLTFDQDGRTPKQTALTTQLAGQSIVFGTLTFHEWQFNATNSDALFDPPTSDRVQEVEQEDLLRVFAAALNFAFDRTEVAPREPARGKSRSPVGGAPTPLPALSVLAHDPAGHGLLCRTQGKTILLVAGTPAQMGAAQGTLLRQPARKVAERVLYLIGGGDTIHSGQWFFDRMAEIERRTAPHIPPRFIEEIDALGRAAGVSRRDARLANLFPERFHCSGVALKGKATQGGRILHARVLDYMRDIDLQDGAVVQVFMPEDRYAWMSLGYAGFVGTVTAMNQCGLSIGEMGGRGEGQWDGMPMSLLLRDVMERAANVEEAMAILRAAPRTCEYYYVLSDRSGQLRAVHCTPQQMTVLGPGQQHPSLPLVPDDTVLISGEDRAALLSRRIIENYGRIDIARLVDIIKRPVAMQSNLHNAIFAPETLDMWFADATHYAPACDQPYAHVNLRELIEFFRRQNGGR